MRRRSDRLEAQPSAATQHIRSNLERPATSVVDAGHARPKRTVRLRLILPLDDMYHPSMKAKVDTLEEERARLEANPLAIPEPEPVVLHPGLAEIYAGKVSKLAEALNEDGTWAEAADLLRGLIEKVIGRSRPYAAVRPVAGRSAKQSLRHDAAKDLNARPCRPHAEKTKPLRSPWRSHNHLRSPGP